jgi:hypothetical protein
MCEEKYQREAESSFGAETLQSRTLDDLRGDLACFFRSLVIIDLVHHVGPDKTFVQSWHRYRYRKQGKLSTGTSTAAETMGKPSKPRGGGSGGPSRGRGRGRGGSSAPRGGGSGRDKASRAAGAVGRGAGDPVPESLIVDGDEAGQC